MNKYLKQYKWSNIKSMLRNNRKSPKECSEDFNDRLVLITGATSGIGYQTARLYASHGANLLCINRNLQKSRDLCKEIQEEFSVRCDYKIADYSHLHEIITIAKELAKIDDDIDVLIHNAGVYNKKKILTDNNIELSFQVNYLGSFILNYYLQDKLKTQGKGRIIFVNSEGHRFAIRGLHLQDLKWEKHHYSGLKGYGASKTAQLLSMIKFDEIFHDTGITINAMHPGNVKTKMGENNGWFYHLKKQLFVNPSSKSPEISAQALYYLGVSPEMINISGVFFNLTTEEIPAPPAMDKEIAEELWDKTLKMVNFT